MSNLLRFYNKFFAVYEVSESLGIIYLDFPKVSDKIQQIGIGGKLHKWTNSFGNIKMRNIMFRVQYYGNTDPPSPQVPGPRVWRGALSDLTQMFQM